MNGIIESNYITNISIETFIYIDYQPGLLLRSRGRPPDNGGRGEAKQTLTRRARLTWMLKIKQLALPIILVIFTASLLRSPHTVFRSVSSGYVYCEVSTAVGL